MKSKIILFLATAVCLSSCYKEDAIKAVKGEPRYVIEDSSDPLDHAIYEIYNATGVYVLYEYEKEDYYWNLGSLYNSSNVLTLQTDRTVLLDGVNYLRKILFNSYPDDFMKKYFPLKIFLAERVDTGTSAALQDVESGVGREYIAVGKIRAGEIPSTAEGLLKAKGSLNAYLWSNVMIQNGLLELPGSFAAVSEKFYGANFGFIKANETGNEDYWYPTDAELMEEGFWDVDPNASMNTYPRVLDPETGRPDDRYNIMPDYVGDINMWIAKITTMTRAEILPLIEPYEKMMRKYEILVGSIQEQLGFDLQGVGADKPQP